MLRIPNVIVTCAALATATGLSFDRFEPADGLLYAQIDLPDPCDWPAVMALVAHAGPVLSHCAGQGEIGRPCLDVALFLEDDRVCASLHVPSAVAALLGRWGFDLDISVYRTAGD